jgi:micrococcal nuclease
MKRTNPFPRIIFRKKALKASGVFGVLFVLLFTLLNEASGPVAGEMRQAILLFFAGSEEYRTASEGWVKVARAVDGDTLELEGGEKVRYIGVNTPETVKPNAPTECFGKEASARNKELVEGKAVRLEKDVSDRDRYGRLLRFVYLEDGTFVNDYLVREGYAYASTFPPDVKLADRFRQAQAEARENKRGLWADDTCKGKK